MVEAVHDVVEAAADRTDAEPVEELLVDEVLHELPAHEADGEPQEEAERLRDTRGETVGCDGGDHGDPEDERDGRMNLREELEELTLEHPAALIANEGLHETAPFRSTLAHPWRL